MARDDRMMGFDHDECMKLGINEAIFIFQIRELSSDPSLDCVEVINGHAWVKKTLNELVEFFPFWTKSQIRRIIASLKNQSAIVVEDLSVNRWRRSAYYRLPSTANEGV